MSFVDCGTAASTRPRFPAAIAACVLTWLVAVGAGLAGLATYAHTPGPAAAAPGEWPQASALARATTEPTLVMFAHPQCACSRASIGELNRLMVHARGRARVHVVFYRPSGSHPAWAGSDLWRSASAIPGVRVSRDEGGAEAGLFGAAVSGQTLLYDADGRLRFKGGITAARGHEGDNAGRAAVLALLDHGSSPAATTRVFGCFLREASGSLPADGGAR